MVEFVNDFLEDGFAGLVAIDFDEKTKSLVVLEDR